MTPSTAPSYTDFSRFSGIRAQAHNDSAGAIDKVAQEFEAMLVQMMLKAARDASPSGGEFDSHEMQLYQEMFDKQVAMQISHGGRLGIADMIKRQIPQASAANEGPAKMTLPERRLFPEHLRAVPLAPTAASSDEEVVDARSWKARVTNRGQLDGQREFAESLLADAARAADRLGTTPEVLIAQAALETGWGRHVMSGSDGQSSHNLFGIKADPSWTGQTVTRETLEYYGGRPVRVKAAFRSYEGFGAAFDDYAQFITSNPRYQSALQQADDPKAYAAALQKAGYASDPQYAHKVIQIHEQIATLAPSAGRAE